MCASSNNTRRRLSGDVHQNTGLTYFPVLTTTKKVNLHENQNISWKSHRFDKEYYMK